MYKHYKHGKHSTPYTIFYCFQGWWILGLIHKNCANGQIRFKTRFGFKPFSWKKKCRDPYFSPAKLMWPHPCCRKLARYARPFLKSENGLNTHMHWQENIKVVFFKMASSSLIFRGGNLKEKTGSIHIPINLPPILSSSFKKRKGEKRPLNCSITVSYWILLDEIVLYQISCLYTVLWNSWQHVHAILGRVMYYVWFKSYNLQNIFLYSVALSYHIILSEIYVCIYYVAS